MIIKFILILSTLTISRLWAVDAVHWVEEVKVVTHIGTPLSTGSLPSDYIIGKEGTGEFYPSVKVNKGAMVYEVKNNKITDDCVSSIGFMVRNVKKALVEEKNQIVFINPEDEPNGELGKQFIINLNRTNYLLCFYRINNSYYGSLSHMDASFVHGNKRFYVHNFPTEITFTDKKLSVLYFKVKKYKWFDFNEKKEPLLKLPPLYPR